MQESFLHYIWQYQYFNKESFTSTQGEDVQVLHVGQYNTDAGPDFSQARILIGGIEWIGHVEIHYKSSQWFDHHHDSDQAYDNVILHVVWEDNAGIQRRDGTTIPTVVLKGRVDQTLITRYRKLVESAAAIPCSNSLVHVPEIIKLSTLDQVLVERVQQKSEGVLAILNATQNDWEESCYRLLCKNFGFKVNEEPFILLAQSLPYKILLKHADQPLQIEALLFGQAGFLSLTKGDAYYQLLRREFKVLRQKYSLEPLHYSQWRFLRLRPANFPTVRISQLASLLVNHKNIFSSILSITDHAQLCKLFLNPVSEYWQEHYHFRKQAKSKIPTIGKSSIHAIIINSVVPLLAAYSGRTDNYVYMERAIDFLQKAPLENNTIVRQWKALGWAGKSSFDSQAMIGLYNQYCVKRKCLSCSIGIHLVSPK